MNEFTLYRLAETKNLRDSYRLFVIGYWVRRNTIFFTKSAMLEIHFDMEGCAPFVGARFILALAKLAIAVDLFLESLNLVAIFEFTSYLRRFQLTKISPPRHQVEIL